MKCWRIGPLSALVLSLGCTSLFDPSTGKLEENLVKWQSAGIESYRFRFQRLCYCISVDALTVEVANGEIVSVVVAETGEQPDAAVADHVLTIADIFAEIQDAIDRDAFSLSVTYHETLGYPLTVDIDYDENTADEEMSYRVSELVELP